MEETPKAMLVVMLCPFQPAGNHKKRRSPNQTRMNSRLCSALILCRVRGGLYMRLSVSAGVKDINWLSQSHV